MKKIKCLILDILENCEKLNFDKNDKNLIFCYCLVWILMKTTLHDLFQKLHEKEKISKTIQITVNS